MPPPLNCPNPICGETVDYWQVQCRCGEFLGFPNYRAAAAEREELMKRYEAALNDAETRRVAHLLAKLEALADQSRPVIAMSFAVCDDILRSDKYRNYDQRTESGERELASAQDHADREWLARGYMLDTTNIFTTPPSRPMGADFRAMGRLQYVGR